MLASKLTSKYQATIPEKIRKQLGLKKGDVIAFKIQKNRVFIKKSAPVDLTFIKSLESTFSEWNSKNDDVYNDL
jgi:AbrB family looped-hinge helix DNA binding protein